MPDYYGVSRPAGGTEKLEPQTHDSWRKGLSTGRLGLIFRTPAEQYVSPGTGNFVLSEDDQGEEIGAAEAARRKGVPVLPGSGIKGAARTTYELLSNSCDPLRKACKGKTRCEACRLFGGFSYQGRISFGDAAPASADDIQVHVERVPIPFTPRRDKTEGDFRFYDLSLHSSRDDPDKGRMAREMFEGSFHGELFFTNVSDEEMGRLLLCLGLGGKRAPRFLLRLGGARYDGWGGLEVQVGQMMLATSPLQRKTYEPEEVGSFIEQWLEAIDDSWFDRYGTALEKIAALHNPRGSSL